MTIFRTRDFLMVILMIATAAVTYKVKYAAQKRIGEIKQIKSQIEAEKDTINLLRADWALLIQPPQLQRLVEYYKTQLNLQHMDPKQMIRLQDMLQHDLASVVTMTETGKNKAGTKQEKSEIPVPMQNFLRKSHP